ncbi:MAG: hypothetical protein ACYTF1_13800 [Planctomycetota bacterium]|jgi:ferric-dicitrate binding protein FerR (iron transport regulator)
MTLTEQAKFDLDRLASGLGTPESDASAKRLVKDDPEAAEYLRQMETVCKSFNPPEDIGEPLSPQETDEVCAAVLSRARRRRLYRFSLPISAVAAILLLACGLTWLAFSHGTSPADLAVDDITYFKRGRAIPKKNMKTKVAAGQQIKTVNDQLARIVYNNWSVAALYYNTMVKISEDNQSLIVQDGRIFIQTQPMMTIQLKEGKAEVQNAQLLARVSDRYRELYVYKGTITVVVGNQSHQVSAGQRVLWASTEPVPIIDTFDYPVPPWARRILDYKDHR